VTEQFPRFHLELIHMTLPTFKSRSTKSHWFIISTWSLLKPFSRQVAIW